MSDMSLRGRVGDKRGVGGRQKNRRQGGDIGDNDMMRERKGAT